MRLLALLLVSLSAFAAPWDRVQQLSMETTIEVTTREGSRTQGAFRSASADSLTIHAQSADHSFSRTDISKIRVLHPGRRVRKGILWTAIGAAAGAGLGFAVCPGCANEGNGAKFFGPGVAIGAGIGALGFLSSDWTTLYKAP
jgi:hypothetical protein